MVIELLLLRDADEFVRGEFWDLQEMKPMQVGIATQAGSQTTLQSFIPYCEVHVDPDITNTMNPRTKWGICMGPTEKRMII